MFPRALIFTFTLTLLIASCATRPATRGEFCEERLPEIDRSIEGALAGMGPWLAQANRIPANASGNAEAAPLPIAARDRASWTSWAEQRLKEAQNDLDHLDTEPELKAVREQIGRLANQLVIFHGYASRGRVLEMARTLQNIRDLNQQARALACVQPATKEIGR